MTKRNDTRSANRQRGLTLVEMSVAFAVLATTAAGISASMMMGMAANRTYRNNTLLLARAQHHVETMFNLQVGLDSDNKANQNELDLVFSGDPELGTNPPTLVALAKKLDDMTDDRYEWQPPNLGFEGTFLAVVTNNVTSAITYPPEVDQNGDGYPEGGASITQGTLTPQDPAVGCYRPADALDDGGELFAFEIYYRPPVPANATPRLILRGFRAQDP